MTVRIESLLSARLFLVPQIVGDDIYFVSNLNGRNSLYVMKHGGSVPQPLLPPDVALQNPHLMDGRLFVVFPQLEKILLMLDQNGDENYQPMWIPIDGGYPEPIYDDKFEKHSVFAGEPDLAENIIYFISQSRTESIFKSYRAHLDTGDLVKLSEGRFGMIPQGIRPDHGRYVFVEQFGVGDHVLYLGDGKSEPDLLFGLPMARREPDKPAPPNGIGHIVFVEDNSVLLFTSVLFDDVYSPGRMALANPDKPTPVPVVGQAHDGVGELAGLEKLANGRFKLTYNIDGVSWVYEAAYDVEAQQINVLHTLVGQGQLANGVLESITYDAEGDRFALSFSAATLPTQIYTIEGADRSQLVAHTSERVLGIPPAWLSPGEDYSFDSFDGLRISARLYLPAAELGFKGPRPLIYYVHGGPQSQERPDFAWFSMPFIQFLTLNGFAVFVPNVRGSTGYGFAYMNHVVRDWGGQDRLDHVHAMTEVLPQDERIDASRAGVVGRSYGGYMTLTLAFRHPELWSAAVDMFGPYNLLAFTERVPETWKPFMAMLVGDPETEQEFLTERSPRTYADNLACPMLVIQGKNDPRVIEQESRELVEELQAQGKKVDYLMFENEGHDVIKYENRVTVYKRMTDFFKEMLRP